MTLGAILKITNVGIEMDARGLVLFVFVAIVASVRAIVCRVAYLACGLLFIAMIERKSMPNQTRGSPTR